jgi:hypothetical protein
MTKAPSNLQELRRRIYRKAKSETTYRFWGLFVHITKIETLDEAYRIAKGNGGAGRPCHRQVQTHAEPPGGDPEGQRQIPNTSNPLYPRPRGSGGIEADPRSSFRGGLLPELLRVSTEAVATSSSGASQAQCDAADVHSH